MRNFLFLCALLALSLTSLAAQTKPTNFAGDWSLDLKKSELPQMMQGIEGMTMNVAQDEKSLKTTSVTTGGRREGGAGGGQTLTYSLDGKETTAEMGGRFGGAATLKASWEKDGKLNLNSVRKANFQGNEFTITTKETWEMTSDGALKITRVSDTPRGQMSSTLYFIKKAS